MASVTGTNNTDYLFFEGVSQHLTLTLVNPYSGELIEVDTDIIVNSQSYDGLGGFDYLMFGSKGEALFLDSTSMGTRNTTVDYTPKIVNIEYIIAGAGGDIVNLSSEVNSYGPIRIDGGAGDDILWTNDGDDQVSGFDGNDHIVTGAGNDYLRGLNDDDYLNGGTGADLLDGGNGNDVLTYTADGTWQNAPVSDLYDVNGLNQSHDTFRGGAGYDVLNLTSGDDALFITDFTSPRHSSASGNRVDGIEEIHAGAGDDVIDLANGSVYQDDVLIYGESGDDFIRSGNGADVLYGGDGDDALYGGAGDDILYGGNNSGSIETYAHLFNDDVVFPTLKERKHIKKLDDDASGTVGIAEGDLTVDYQTTATFTFIESGAGYRNTLGFYRINHADGTIEGVEVGFANVKAYQTGTAYTVDLPGAPDSDFGFFILANGYTRNQSYKGLDIEGTDHLKFIYDYGGAGERAATIYDDGGKISLVYDDGETVKVLKGEVYHTTARGEETILNDDGENHVVSGLADENDQGVLRIGFEDLKNLGDADYNDVVFDLTIGGRQIDTSEAGNDLLDGGAGDDILYGEGGNDILIIGDGADIAYGGSGSDLFVVSTLDGAVDEIRDFDIMGHEDMLDIHNILEGYDPLSDAIDDFVRLTTQDNGDVMVSVQNQGAFEDAVLITGGVDGQSLQQLIENGQLIVDANTI